VGDREGGRETLGVGFAPVRFYTCWDRDGRQRFVGSEMNGRKKSGHSRKRSFLAFMAHSTIFFFSFFFLIYSFTYKKIITI
jgi:hypothetical protein